MGTHRYRAYGLAIVSDIALPELEPDTRPGTPDLVIRDAPTGRGAPGSFASDVLEFGPDEQFLCWPTAGGFLIRGDAEILVERDVGVADNLLAFPLLGPVMAVVLHLKGFLVLHASAVAKDEKAAVFLGDKLAGKSTTAAAMLRAGFTLLTDDLLAIEAVPGGAVMIAPGFPQIKLSEEAEAALVLEGASKMPVADEAMAKRQQRLSVFSHERVRPTAIYVLARGDEAAARRLNPAEALSAIVKFSYIARFPMRPVVGDEAREHLRQCASLANAAPIYRLDIPQGLDRLEDVVALVERDLG